jgi:hypothetical protein
VATVFPKKRLQDGEVLDGEAINSSFGPMSEEASSALGEHNWYKTAFRAADLDPTAALVATSVSQQSNNSVAVGSTDIYTFDSLPDPVYPANSYLVNREPAWLPVPDISITVTTGNSLLWIMASLQYSFYHAIWPFNKMVTAFCLARNGAPIPDTITSTADPANDSVATGVSARRFPVVMDTLIPVSPGDHTFTVLVSSKFSNPSLWTIANPVMIDTVDNRELIVLEMK